MKLRLIDLQNQRNHHDALLRHYQTSASALVSLYIAETYRSAYPKTARQVGKDFLEIAKNCSDLYSSTAPLDFEKRLNMEADKKHN